MQEVGLWARQAVRVGATAADALVWLDAADLDELTRALAAAPPARWVQLPFAGVETGCRGQPAGPGAYLDLR
jgi:hypothetical protein